MKRQTDKEGLLLDLLAELAPSSSKHTLKSWIREGRVTIDGMVAKRNTQPVEQGQTIELLRKHSYASGGIRVLYEDRALLVIDKPQGLLTVATDYQDQETAHAFLKERYGNTQIHVVHRIDRETSGVMLFARNKAARDKLKAMFEAHQLEREYRAVVEGHVEPERGCWKSRLIEGKDYNVRLSKTPDEGRLAITHYQRLSQGRNYCYLRLILETGRKHQIRVHCQEAGYPVVGDERYGATTNPVGRLCLHAHRIAFNHPLTGKALDFRSPVPSLLTRLVPKVPK